MLGENAGGVNPRYREIHEEKSDVTKSPTDLKKVEWGLRAVTPLGALVGYHRRTFGLTAPVADLDKILAFLPFLREE